MNPTPTEPLIDLLSDGQGPSVKNTHVLRLLLPPVLETHIFRTRRRTLKEAIGSRYADCAARRSFGHIPGCL